MLLIHCPYCEADLPELEFHAAGEAHLIRPSDMGSMSDEDFRDYFFVRDNPKGVSFERWRHLHGCGRFFNALRDTVSDKFLHVYKAGEAKPEVDSFLHRSQGTAVGTRDHKMGGQPR